MSFESARYRRLGIGIVVALGSIFWGLATAVAAEANSTPSTIDGLQQRAETLGLAQSDLWRALVHYEPNTLGGGVYSEVASGWFFLAGPAGRSDPAAELDATVAALFSPKPVGPRQLPAYCLFVARRKFLVAALNIDTSRLPVHDCPGYRRWKQTLDVRAADLVFPSAFPDSPSSMFGHTLLRLDAARDGVGANPVKGTGTELLSYAVNFAAAAPDDKRGLGFVWKGLTGGYPGEFGLFPYYKKVKQYAFIENRDVWSWRLNLSPAALDRLVDHIWAMDQVEFDYYFFNKNCAYQLLSLVDVAKPSLHLTRRYRWYAIPSDTIRSLADVPGLLGPAHFRASKQATLHWETAALSAADQALARHVARHRLAPDAPAIKALPLSRQAGVLEVAYDALHYRLSSDTLSAPQNDKPGSDTAESEAYANHILAVRAALEVRSPFSRVPRPERTPDTGHRSLRLRAAAVHADDKTSLAFRLRPAYHDLLDNPGGYTRGQAIDLGDTGLALDPENGHVALHDFTLISVTSLSQRDAWFQPVSFNLAAGARRRPSTHVFTGRQNDLGAYLQGGPGLAWGHRDLTGYLFGEVSLDANPALAPAYALGAGPEVGLLYYPRPGVQLRLDSGWIAYGLGADGHYGWAGLGAQVPLVRNLALRSHIEYENTRRDDGLRIDFGLQAYF